MHKLIKTMAGLVMLTATLPVWSDEVTLLNGNTIDGEFKELQEQVIKFDTTYLGLLTIQVAHISKLVLDEPMGILLESGESISVQVIELEEGQLSAYESADGERAETELVDVVGMSDQKLSEIKKGVWKGQVNLAARTESGNGDRDVVNLDFDVQYRRPGDRFRLSGEWDRDKSESPNTGLTLTIRDEWLISGYYDYFIDDKRYITGILSFESDETEGLDLRSTIGPLYGYQFYESLERNLLLEAGLLWVKEEYRNFDEETFWKPAWHLKYDQLFFETPIQLYHEQFGTVTASGDTRWLVRASTGFRIPVRRSLQFGIEHRLEYDSEPVGNVDELESTLSIKLGYVW